MTLEELEYFVMELNTKVDALKIEVNRHKKSNDHDVHYATQSELDSIKSRLNLHITGSDHDYRYPNRNDVSHVLLNNFNLMKSDVFTLIAPNGSRHLLKVNNEGQLVLEAL